jgi:hypothetical protein
MTAFRRPKSAGMSSLAGWDWSVAWAVHGSYNRDFLRSNYLCASYKPILRVFWIRAKLLTKMPQNDYHSHLDFAGIGKLLKETDLSKIKHESPHRSSWYPS